MIQAQLGPWPAVAVIAIGAGLAVLGVWLPNGLALVQLGTFIVGGIMGALQAQRPPGTRTRATDRILTSAEGVTPAPQVQR